MSSISQHQNSFWASIPLWAPLGVFILAFMILMTNYGMTPVDVSIFATPQEGSTGSTAKMNSYEARELLVYDPSASISSDIVRSGYAVIETLELKELGIRVQRLRVPAGLSVPEALADLRNRYPALEIDANHQIRLTDPS